jgi:hypothetical protein
METLDSFDYFMVTALLSQLGFNFQQEISVKSELWYNDKSNKAFEIKRSAKILQKIELLKIIKQAGLSKEEFMNLIQ